MFLEGEEEEMQDEEDRASPFLSRFYSVHYDDSQVAKNSRSVE